MKQCNVITTTKKTNKLNIFSISDFNGKPHRQFSRERKDFIRSKIYKDFNLPVDGTFEVNDFLLRLNDALTSSHCYKQFTSFELCYEIPSNLDGICS